MKLIVRNIDRSITEAELRKLFEDFGTVQSCNLVLNPEDGSSKGFGFVEMPKNGEAKAAMKNLNDQVLGNKQLRVKKADDKKT